MNQKIESSGADVGKKAVVSSFPNTRKLRLSKDQASILLRLCLVGVLVIVLGVLIDVAVKNSAHYKTDKVHALVKANDCSSKAQQSISSYKPSTKQVNFSIALLSYQAHCLVSSRHYQQANALLEELKHYYALNNDQVGAANVNSQIANNNHAATVKVPANSGNAQPEISTQQAQQIQNFYRKTP